MHVLECGLVYLGLSCYLDDCLITSGNSTPPLLQMEMDGK